MRSIPTGKLKSICRKGAVCTSCTNILPLQAYFFVLTIFNLSDMILSL